MIAAEQISVVVQGPSLRASAGDAPGALTREVLLSLRRILPGAELILSTWRDQPIDRTLCDRVVENDDPGHLGRRDANFLANTARQIVSTRRGLDVATRPYALKVRTDTPLHGADFVGYWETHCRRGLAARLLAEKILISAFSTYNPARVPIPFHPSDFFQFGATADLRRLWQVPAPTLADAEFFPADSAECHANMTAIESHRRERVTPEQFLFLAFARERGRAIPQAGIRSANPARLLQSEFLLASHFIPMDPATAGFDLPARFRPYLTPEDPHFRDDWQGPLFTAPTHVGACVALLARLPRLAKAAARELRRRASVARNHVPRLETSR